jgi:hypothetical protein
MAGVDMNDKQLVGVLLLLGVGAWWLMRNRGGSLPATNIAPQQASTAGGATGIGTGLAAGLSTIAADIAKLFSVKTSAPGNVTAFPTTPAAPPTGGTTSGTSTPLQAPLSPYQTGAALPVITDPNQPWLTNALGFFDQLPDFASHSDVLMWTLDPVSLGFDPNAIPAPGGAGMSYPTSYPTSGISIVGVE